MEQFSVRKYTIAGIVIMIALVFILKLFYLQVIDESYRLPAENNSRRVVTLLPARGLFFDRDGELLVYNQAAYDLVIAPYQLQEFDTAELCTILNIDREFLVNGIERSFMPRYRREPFIKQVSAETYAELQEKLYRFPGFYVQPRTLRKYSSDIAAHLIGYVGEVDDKIIEENDYYSMGDYIGISGIEKTYEEYLRGEKGREIYNVDVHGRVQGVYEGGRYNEPAVVGKNLTLTIDADLQTYGEKLMEDFRGSIVAIEPQTGEILAMVTAPNYDPSLLVGRERTKNYRKLQSDTLKPIFNRALMAQYPPGSTFKMINALIGLQENVVNPKATYYVDGAYYARGVTVKDHVYGYVDMVSGIQKSSNAYFCHIFRNIIEDRDYPSVPMAFNNWRDHLLSFGFGRPLGSDFPNELSGYVPNTSYYDRYYGEGRWKALTIISLAIGQGELGITPLQLANMTAALANKGYYYTPHVVKKIEGIDTLSRKFTTPHFTTIDSSHFPVVLDGMEMAVNGGEGSTSRIAKINDIVVCGKTGTAENPHGEDHSVFSAFAPRENPQIAIAVYVEHGKWGSTYAAPIASLMIEKYLTDTVSRKWVENLMLNATIDY
ncbi:MAG: penicillin-binding protein 2 [Bacteroidota bacterium]